MRFGLCYRSENSEDIRYYLLLVDKELDIRHDQDPRVEFGDDTYRMGEYLAFTIERLSGLVNLLLDKGVISQAELDAIRSSAERKLYGRTLDFRRVRDLDGAFDFDRPYD